MKVLFVTSEVTPFSKTGGLAEVSCGLPRALKKLGHEVSIVSPKYRSVKYSNCPIEKIDKAIGVPISWKLNKGQLFGTEIDGIPVYLIANDELFDREGLYGTEYGDYQDNAERFIFFSRAALEMCISSIVMTGTRLLSLFILRHCIKICQSFQKSLAFIPSTIWVIKESSGNMTCP